MGEIHWQPASSRARKKRIGPIGLWQEKEKCQGEEDTTNKAGSECIGHCPRHSPAHEEGICQRRRQPYYLFLFGVPFKEPENGTLHNTHTHRERNKKQKRNGAPQKDIILWFSWFHVNLQECSSETKDPPCFSHLFGGNCEGFSGVCRLVFFVLFFLTGSLANKNLPPHDASPGDS